MADRSENRNIAGMCQFVLKLFNDFTNNGGRHVHKGCAVIRIQNKYFVYRVIGGKAVSTEITVLPSVDNQHYVVISGLNDRDVIIAENAGMVSEGMKITQETKKTEP